MKPAPLELSQDTLALAVTEYLHHHKLLEAPHRAGYEPVLNFTVWADAFGVGWCRVVVDWVERKS